VKDLLRLVLFTLLFSATHSMPGAESTAQKVFIIPIRENIDDPLVYLVRRGVKLAMDAKADTLILDMDTNGGSVKSMIEIVKILSQFKGLTVTYVDHKAFSAGAIISFATQKIYMAPDAVAGAAAPVMLSPTGGGVEAMPDTMEAKSASAISAMVRVNAEKNGHNVEVADAMIRKTKELKIDGKVFNEKGQLLTLTANEATKKYGNPARPLYAVGIAGDLDQLVTELGLKGAVQTYVEPTGAEQVAFWLNTIAPLLLMIGVIGIYLEFKTPGFGLPGVVGIVAFALYFLGGYVAGLSGIEWVAVFVIGLVLVALELFVFPGTAALGGMGALLMFASIIMAMVDYYPGMPALPTLPQLQLPLTNIVIAAVGCAVAIWVLSRYLPRTPLYAAMVSGTASGVESVKAQEQQHSALIGQTGTALSPLRPGGKAQFGDQILDVMSQGDLIPKGARVKIISFSGTEAVVEAVG
jgi:membrane-bound serine protease (ClpP class)